MLLQDQNVKKIMIVLNLNELFHLIKSNEKRLFMYAFHFSNAYWKVYKQ